MKKQLHLLSLFVFAGYISHAQRIGIGTLNPVASAQLEISSTNKGLLIPRVALTSVTDVSTIPGPAVSLMVYNTNNALADGVGYYYWDGSKWLKLITNTAAGGDLSGNFPNPKVSKLNGVPILNTVPAFGDGGKTLRYNSITQQYELQNPIVYGETITPGFIGLSGQGTTPPRLTKAGDNANMIPLCYGNYNAASNTASGLTANVTLTRITAGSYRLTITPASIGTAAFEPAVLCTLNDFGVINYSIESANSVIVSTYQTNGYLADIGFGFIIFNN